MSDQRSIFQITADNINALEMILKERKDLEHVVEDLTDRLSEKMAENAALKSHIRTFIESMKGFL